jgi:N5-(cytidine 5'-diphosphoramidyl)-L-glutamine hydrolase
MKILISQIEYIKPPRNFVFDALERAYYTWLDKHQLIVAPNINKVVYNDYDCLILTGGPDSIARNKTENLLYKDALQKGKPIVGICHGAFAINDICGGENGHVDGHVDADITISMQGQKHSVRCYHSQSIDKLAKDFIAIAHDEQGIVEAFEHNTLPIYGIVWHPERMEDPVLPSAVEKLLA